MQTLRIVVTEESIKVSRRHEDESRIDSQILQ